MTDEYIEASYLIQLYHTSAGIKDDARDVARTINKLPTKGAKLTALKTNITIRVKGFGWEWAHHPWSRNGVPYTTKQLGDHLRWIIKQEKKRKLIVPIEPKPIAPKRKGEGVLGTRIALVDELDKKYSGNNVDLKRNAAAVCRIRGDTGEESAYSHLQPFYIPSTSDLMSTRIYVLFDLQLEGGGSALRWCQGEVVHIYENKQKPTVRVAWDACPDIEGSENGHVSDQQLLPTKFNKNMKGAWRMDVDVVLHNVANDVANNDIDVDEESSGTKSELSFGSDKSELIFDSESDGDDSSDDDEVKNNN